jgi:hypothetical protein
MTCYFDLHSNKYKNYVTSNLVTLSRSISEIRSVPYAPNATLPHNSALHDISYAQSVLRSKSVDQSVKHMER